jgi:hypothetical protein
MSNAVLWSGVVYRGPSAYDGAEVIAYLTIGSKNRKTGSVATLWLLAAHEPPLDAQRSGVDASVCGACPLRPKLADVRALLGLPKGCYVKTYRMRAMWERARSLEPNITEACFALIMHGIRTLRLGGYGDPAALPEDSRVVQRLAAVAMRRLGYTHAWRDPAAQWLRPYCMASTESELASWQAWAMGWRSFRQSPSGEPLARLECACPAAKGTTCAQCGLCHGAGSERSVTIAAHN